MRESRKPPSLIIACGVILAAAVILGAVFNLVMPQGVGLRPQWVSAPLWRPAGPARAAQLKAQGALLLDARDASDYKRERVRGAVNLSPAEFSLLYPLLKPSLDSAKSVVVYGRYTSRFPAAQIGQMLKKQGMQNIYVVEASIQDLEQAGLGLQKPRRRQGS